MGSEKWQEATNFRLRPAVHQSLEPPNIATPLDCRAEIGRVDVSNAADFAPAFKVPSTRPANRRYEWTKEEDDILRAEYGRSRKASRSAIEKILQMHPDWSRHTVIRRARIVGLAQQRSEPRKPWPSALDHYLLSLAGCQLDTIAQRLGRSKKAVLARLRRLGKSAEFFGGFKTKDLVLELLVAESTINRWVRAGWLERKKGRITEESLRRLCRHHPEEIPFEMLSPETQNWLKLSMDFGKGAGRRHGGRQNPTPAGDATVTHSRLTKSSASWSHFSKLG